MKWCKSSELFLINKKGSIGVMMGISNLKNKFLNRFIIFKFKFNSSPYFYSYNTICSGFIL
jgi:hypothetical protein